MPKLTTGQAIAELGGIDARPEDFEHTVDGFGQYLRACNSSWHFSAREWCLPLGRRRRRIMRKVGRKNLLPPYRMWGRGVVLALVADIMRDAAREPVVIRWWWRPRKVNKAAGSKAKRSDHIKAYGVDLGFKTARGRRRAERAVKRLRKRFPKLRISLGLGNKTIHVGALSGVGARTWEYRSYRP